MKIYQQYLNEYTNRLMGYQALAIIGQSCLGSVTAMVILMNGVAVGQMIQLFIIISMCMGYNAAILSQQKAKISFNLLLISVLSSIFFFVVNVI
jgi:4-hydroxybenzoate polyprenyltransferase